MPRKPKVPPSEIASAETLRRLVPTYGDQRVRDLWRGVRQTQSSLWQAGYAQGLADAYRALVSDPEATIKRAKEAVAQSEAVARQRTDASALRDRAEDPAVKAARTQHLKRLQRDEAQASEFAALIRAGDTTEAARAKMGIGAVRAKRLRAIAVRLKWIRPRQKKAGSIL